MSAAICWSIALLLAGEAALTILYIDEVAAMSGVGPSLTQQDAARGRATLTVLFDLAVFGTAWALLGWFLSKGQHPARIALTVLATVSLLAGVPGLLPDRPLPVVLVAVAQLVLQVAVLLFLWRSDATDFLRTRHRS